MFDQIVEKISNGGDEDEAGKKLDLLISYMREILLWNEKVNLTSITDEQEFLRKHILDSLLITEEESYKKAERIIDVGTGAGFPGVPLAVMNPEKEVVLLDSLRKRLDIIREITAKLGITNIKTCHMRAEDAGRDDSMRESFDLCVSRAVARMPVLTELCLPLVKKGGSFIAYKGPMAYEEVEEAKKAIATLGGNDAKIIKPAGQGTESHTLVIIKKEEKTPQKYPRRAGEPSKKPIL